MFFRFIGGGGAPLPIQNIIPVIFNMRVKNYFFSTLVGIIPTTFVTVALGAGIESVISNDVPLDFLTIMKSPEIHLPIIGFAILLIITFLVKKFFFKSVR